jgi:uncharacterized membrane protein
VTRVPREAAIPPLRLHFRGVPLLLAVSGWAVLGITAVAGHGLIRSVAVFAFALFGPGTAVVRLLPLRDFLERAVLAVALGLSLATLAAEAMAIAQILSPALVLAVLASICTAAALAEMAREAEAPC